MNTGRDRDRSVERLLQRSLAAGDSSTPDAGSECPDAETLAAWVDGGLGQREVALVEAHASRCARCQSLLAVVVQTGADPSVSASQESRQRGWGRGWLVPLAAGVAAAVILWVVVPDDQRPDLPEQAGAQLPSALPTQPQPEAEKDRFNAPAVPPEQPRASNATGAAKADDKAASIAAPERELRKENTAPEGQPAAERLDALSARAAAPPSAADAAEPHSALNEAGALSRQEAAKTAPVEITSPNPSVRWRTGGNGSVEHTTNDGTTWEAVPTGVSADLIAGASPSRLVCWLVGRAGTVLLSTDGRSWQRVPFPEMTDLTAVKAADARTATVTTNDGRTFRTTDGGLTWARP